MADPGRELGYEFSLGLGAAIEASVKRAGPRAFRYRGADLSHAAERDLFITLVNREDLYEAFCSSRRDERPEPFEDPSWLAQSVAAALLEEPGRARASLGARGGRLRSGARFSARRSGARRSKPAGSTAEAAPRVCFVLDHSKFLRFIEPLTAELGEGGWSIISAADDLTALLERDGQEGTVPFLPLRAGGDWSPASRRAGWALRERPQLPAIYDMVLERLSALRPRVVVVIEGNAPLDEITNRAARSLGIPSVCLQQGWSPVIHPGFRNMSYSRMLLWGEGFEELLAPFNPEQRFDISGNPAFAQRPDAGPEPPLEPGQAGAAFFMQSESQLIGAAHLSQFLELIATAARRFPDQSLLVREHPAWPLSTAQARDLEKLPNVRLVSPASYSLTEVLRASRLAVSIYSTSLIEAAALGTPPLVFNPTSLPRYIPDVEELGIGVEADRPEAALEQLDRLMHDEAHRSSLKPGMDRFRQRFFAGADDEAPRRIAAVIDELAPGARS